MALTTFHPLRRGEIVQFGPNPRNPLFAGCLMVVTEPGAWGAQGFVPIPGGNEECGCGAYYNATFWEIYRTGGISPWVLKDEVEGYGMTGNNIVPFTQPTVSAVSLSDMERLALAVAKSGLFGIKTPDQALALMAIAQAEGRHPALAARDYHIIGGTPSKKAEAMLRDFFMAGGKVEWHELSDDAAEATFSHPIGGTVKIRWDSARVEQAGLNNPNHKKYPRQMKRSRVISEGVRTVWPLATSGFYVPEEVVDFDPRRASIEHSEAPAEQQRSAESAAPADVIDGETGEVFDAAQIEREARSAATGGMQALRDHLAALPDDAYDMLRPLLGTKDNPGELRILARRSDEAIREAARDAEHEGPTDAFGLAPYSGEPHPNPPAGTTHNRKEEPGSLRQERAGGDLLERREPRPGECYVPLPDHPTAMNWDEWHFGVIQKLESYPAAAVLRDNRSNLEIFRQVDEMRYEALARKLGAN